MKHARQKWLSLNFTRLKALISCLVNGLHPSLYKWFQVLNRLESIGKPFCDLQMNHARSSAPSRAGQGEENILRTFAGCTVLTKNSTHRLQLAKFPSLWHWVYHKKHPFYSLQPHHSHLKVEAPIAVQATKETRAAKAFPPRGYHDALSWGNQKCPHWLRMSIDVHCFCWFQPIYLYLTFYIPKIPYMTHNSKICIFRVKKKLHQQMRMHWNCDPHGQYMQKRMNKLRIDTTWYYGIDKTEPILALRCDIQYFPSRKLEPQTRWRMAVNCGFSILYGSLAKDWQLTALT